MASISELAQRLAALLDGELTEDQLAQAIGTTQQSVNRWKNGARPKQESWEGLQRALGVSAGELERMLPPSSRKNRRRFDRRGEAIEAAPSDGGKSASEVEELVAENVLLKREVAELRVRARENEIVITTLRTSLADIGRGHVNRGAAVGP